MQNPLVDGGSVLDWYAVYVKSRHERAVASILTSKGYDVCLPTIRKLRNWSDRRKELEFPAFPGYVFCRFNAHLKVPILDTPGVFTIVGTSQAPTPLDPEEVNALQTLSRAKAQIEPCPFLCVGQWVRIEGGSLDGLTGILTEFKKQSRVVVSVILLQRSVSVEVDRATVRETVPPPTQQTPVMMRRDR